MLLLHVKIQNIIFSNIDYNIPRKAGDYEKIHRRV